MIRKINIWTNIDWVTVLLYLVLVVIGLINIYSAVSDESHQGIFDFSSRYGKQFTWIIAALIMAIAIMLVDGKFFSVFAYILYALSVLSLLAVLVFGMEINNSKSWFQIGAFSLQPAEFAKVGVALALAQYLSTPNIKIHSLNVVFRFVLIIFLPASLILLQPDVGTALVFLVFLMVIFREGVSLVYIYLAIFMALLFLLAFYLNNTVMLVGLVGVVLITSLIVIKNLRTVAIGFLIIGLFVLLTWGVVFLIGNIPTWDIILIISIILSSPVILYLAFHRKIKYVFGLLAFFIVVIVYTSSIDYIFNNVLKPHQQTRIHVMLGIKSDPLGYGYNINQSKIAIGSGGIFGKGFLQGTQTKFDFVPEQTTDFIFCTIGEEWGFVGSFIFIAIFSGLLIRLIHIAERQRSAFSRIYGYGVVMILFFHMTVNIGMTIGLVPVIGIPLPFISYGGSSLWAFTMLLFIFLRLDVGRLEMLK